jgi:hypothetical protein
MLRASIQSFIRAVHDGQVIAGHNQLVQGVELPKILAHAAGANAVMFKLHRVQDSARVRVAPHDGLNAVERKSRLRLSAP